MDRLIGTVSMGVRTPIIETGDNLVDIVFDSVNKAVESKNIEINDKEIELRLQVIFKQALTKTNKGKEFIRLMLL